MTKLSLFKNSKPIIGMVHLLPLPGSPYYNGSMQPILERARSDALILHEANYDGMIIENYFDKPYITGLGPLERTVAFTIVLNEIRKIVSIPVGVNIQFNDYEAEIITAGLCEANFVRIEAFVDSLTTPGGITPACAAEVQRLKARFGFKELVLFADVHVKEATLIGNTTFLQSLYNAEEAGADAIIVTGSTTGQAPPLTLLEETRKHTSLDIFVGSGLNKFNAYEMLSIADGAIVGSSIKVDGKTSNPIDPVSARELITVVRGTQ